MKYDIKIDDTLIFYKKDNENEIKLTLNVLGITDIFGKTFLAVKKVFMKNNNEDFDNMYITEGPVIYVEYKEVNNIPSISNVDNKYYAAVRSIFKNLR